MGRPPCCDKANVKRGLWTAEEDAKILAYVSTHGTGNWTQVPKRAGLNRCGKSCRLRWTNYLRPDLKHEEFTEQEEELIIQYHAAIGSRWSLIAKQLPGRTDNDVKNYWNTKLKKKLMKMGIDPITHKPFTNVFLDYQTISSLTTNYETTMLDNGLATALSSQCRASSSIQSGVQTATSQTHMMEHIQDVYYSSDNCLLQQESFNHYMEDLSPSSSSSSSSSSNGQSSSCLFTNQPSSALVMSTAYNWGDHSFVQPIETTDIKEEEHNIQGFLATDRPAQNQDNTDQCEPALPNLDTATDSNVGASDCNGENTETSNHYDPSSVSSFVKGLLDRDSEMQLSFPVFEDILDY